MYFFVLYVLREHVSFVFSCVLYEQCPPSGDNLVLEAGILGSVELLQGTQFPRLAARCHHKTGVSKSSRMPAVVVRPIRIGLLASDWYSVESHSSPPLFY